MAFLPVFDAAGSSVGVATNVNGRIDVLNAAGTLFEIVNDPDAVPALGGNFPVYYLSEDGLFTEPIPRQIPYSDVEPINSYVGQTDGEAAQGSRGYR